MRALANKTWLVLNLALVAAVLASAIAVVESAHHCRTFYARLQRLQVEQWEMQEQWGRLLLEQSTWAAHHRVEGLAHKKLDMYVPGAAELQVVRP